VTGIFARGGQQHPGKDKRTVIAGIVLQRLMSIEIFLSEYSRPPVFRSVQEHIAADAQRKYEQQRWPRIKSGTLNSTRQVKRKHDPTEKCECPKSCEEQLPVKVTDHSRHAIIQEQQNAQTQSLFQTAQGSRGLLRKTIRGPAQLCSRDKRSDDCGQNDRVSASQQIAKHQDLQRKFQKQKRQCQP